MEEQSGGGLSRRHFLAGAGLTAAAATGLVACSPSSETGPSQSPSSGQTDSGASASTNGRYTWENPPARIASDAIAETHEADIVIVGAGIAGCVGALTALQEGASVICLQKHTETLTNGIGIGAYNSQIQKDAGVELDVEDMFETWSTWAENRVNRKMYNLWVQHSGECVDWLLENLEMGADEVPVDRGVSAADVKATPFKERVYPTVFGFDVPAGIAKLGQKAEEAGVQFFFGTPAVQLVRGEDDKSGRVTAVIGQNADGDYLEFKASKAVILCAGDYANNMEMRGVWAPHLADLTSPYQPPVNTGDGLVMGMWVGAGMDLGPHVSNIHYDVAFADTREPFCGSGGAQWLRVNIEGERFSDEDCAYQQIYAQDIDQPGQMHYQIMDAKHPDQWQLFYGGVMRGNGNTGPGPEASRDVWAAVLENAGEDPNQYENVYDLVVAGAIAAGIGFKADTIEGLATEMGVPPEALKATVDRYNELAAQGVDLDFGKNPDFLWPIDTPPYYALSRRAHPLGVLNGLRINTEMQVLDKDGEVIEALYAAGNNSGGNYFGGMVQPMCAPAMTTGRALLTGRLAALNAAGA